MKRLVIDSETGGLWPSKHSLLTIGMLLIDVKQNKLNFLDNEHIFIKHSEYSVSKTAMRINKIDLFEHHKKGVFPSVACKKINSFLDKHLLYNVPVVGHNVSFDIGFINSLFNSECFDYPFHKEKEDTMHLWNQLKKKGVVSPFYNSKLGTIAKHFEIDYSKAHDALADCHITAKVYHKILSMNT